MAELEKKSRKELELEIAWEKRAKKILLICSAVCCGIGLIVGVVYAISEGTFGAVLGGIWIGIGIGGVIGFIPNTPHFFKQEMEKKGFGEALKSTLIGILGALIVFSFIGPIGLLIRILRINQRIKKFEESLSEVGE